MAKIFQFLPLLFWAAFGFFLLYTLLETDFRPVGVILRSFAATLRIARRWKITLALFGLFGAAPIVAAVVLVVLKIHGQRAILAGMLWQAATAMTIAWIATHIHQHTLILPSRDASAQRRYRLLSSAVGLALFFFTVAYSIGSSIGIQLAHLQGRYGAVFWVQMAQTLLFVPMALIRPALSLGEKTPVRAAFGTAARSPMLLFVWVTALALPAIGFSWIGGDILKAHQSPVSEVVFLASKALFNAIDCIFFETTTLLLFARATGRLSMDWHETYSDFSSGPLALSSEN
jgi:hypothetical protein